MAYSQYLLDTLFYKVSFKIEQYPQYGSMAYCQFLLGHCVPSYPRGKTRGELIMVFIVSEAYTYVDDGSQTLARGCPTYTL